MECKLGFFSENQSLTAYKSAKYFAGINFKFGSKNGGEGFLTIF